MDGQHEVCHIVGNALFTSYHTRLGGARQDMLWSQELRFWLNAEALAWLERTSLPAPLCKRPVLALPWERALTRVELHAQLRTIGITLGRQHLQQVGDTLAVAYHAQTRMPMVAWLLSDDATVYDYPSDGHGLCWVQD